MTVQCLVGYETGDTSEILSLASGCSVVAAPGSGNAGAYSFKNDCSSVGETALTAALNLTRVRGSFRFYVGANPGGTTDSYYSIFLRDSSAGLIADLYLMYDKTGPGGVPGWWFGLYDSADSSSSFAGNYVTPGSNPVLGWVTFEFDIEVGATSTVHDVWYTRDADGIRYKIGATGNGTDNPAPSTMNFGTMTVWTINTKWYSTSGASEPYYIDDIVVDDAALPGDARVISRQFISTTPVGNDWEKSSGTIDTVWSDTPFNLASYARTYLSSTLQTARVSPFSATQTGKGSGVIDSNDVILGWSHGVVGKADFSDLPGIVEIGTGVSGTSTAGANVTLTFSVAPGVGDVVIVWGGFGTAGAANPGISTAGYTNLVLETATAARRFGVWYKTMGWTPDTNVVCLGSGSAGDGVAYGCLVLRQALNYPTVLDISAPAPATGTGTAPNPPASGATFAANTWLLAFGAAAIHDTSKGVQAGYTALVNMSVNATRPYSTTASRLTVAAASTNTDPPVWPNWGAASWVAATINIRPTVHSGYNLYRATYFTGGGYQYTFSALDWTAYTYTSRLGHEGFGVPPAGGVATPTLAELDGSDWGFLRDSVALAQTVADQWAMVAYRPVATTTIDYSDTITPSAIPVVGTTIIDQATYGETITNSAVPIVGATISDRLGWVEPAVTPSAIPIVGASLVDTVARFEPAITPSSVPIVGASLVDVYGWVEPAVTPSTVPILGQIIVPIYGYNDTITASSVPIIGQAITSVRGRIDTITPSTVPIVGASLVDVFAQTEPVVTASSLPIVGSSLTDKATYSEVVAASALPIVGAVVTPVFSAGGINYSDAIVASTLPISGATLVDILRFTDTITPSTVPIVGATISDVRARSDTIVASSIPIVGATLADILRFADTITPSTIPIVGASISDVRARSDTITASSIPIVGKPLADQTGYIDVLIAASIPIDGQQIAVGIALTGSITVQININCLDYSVHPIWNPISDPGQIWTPIDEMSDIWVPINESDQTWVTAVETNPRFTA